jgi:hypothetical protein
MSYGATLQAGGLRVLVGRRLRLRAGARRPEHPAAEDRQRRRDERDHDVQADEHRKGQPGAEDPEVLELRGQQAGCGRHDRQPGDQHDHHHVRCRLRGPRLVARAGQTIEEPGQEEDRVVRDDAEQQHDDDRLDLAGNGHAEVHPDPLQQAGGDQVGDRDRGQVEQRSAERPEVEAHRQQDEHHGRDFHARQVVGDDLAPRERRRHRPGDLDLHSSAQILLQPVGHDDVAAEQWEREQRLREALGPQRVCLPGDDAADRSRPRLLYRGKLRHRPDGRRDPEDHDDVAQPDHEADDSRHRRPSRPDGCPRMTAQYAP